MKRGRISYPCPDWYPQDVKEFMGVALAIGAKLVDHVDGTIRLKHAGEDAKRYRALCRRQIESAVGHAVDAVLSELHTDADEDRNGTGNRDGGGS